MDSKLHTKRLIKRLAYSKPVALVLLVLAVASVYWTVSAYQKMEATGERVEKLQERKERLQEREEVLNKKINEIKTARGKEEEIRRKYSVTKEGERLVVIMDRAETENNGSKEGGGFLQRISDWVTGVFD